MPKCHKFYPNCQWTVTHCWPDLALDIVFLTKVYWSYSTRIVRVCFTPLLQPTLKRDLKRKSNVQIAFNSSAMDSLYELCATILLEISIQLWINSLPFFKLHYLHFILPQQYRPLYPKQQIVILASFKIFQCILLKKFFGMCNPNTTEY